MVRAFPRSERMHMGDRWYEEGQPVATEWEAVALAFVARLLNRDFRSAREMLAGEFRSRMTETELERRTLRLISEEDVPMSEPWVISSIDSWPGKLPSECGAAYVVIGGDFNEAITPTVVDDDGRLCIGQIAWQRP